MVRRVSGYKKIRYYTHENIGYGPVNLPDQELHTTALWWQLPQSVLEAAFDVAAGGARRLPRRRVCAASSWPTVSVMAEARDLQKAVGSGDGAWFASGESRGRGHCVALKAKRGIRTNCRCLRRRCTCTTTIRGVSA